MPHRLLLLTSVALLAAPAAAQSPETVAFVARLGNDTVAVERYTRTPTEITGVSVVRSPRTTMRRYTITLGPDGTARRLHITLAHEGGPVMQDVTYDYASDDSVRIESRRDSVVRHRAVAATGRPLPFFPDLYATWDLELRDAHDANEHFAMLAGGQMVSYAIERTGDGAVDLTNPSTDYGPLHARLDDSGHLLSLDLTATTDKYRAERVSDLDVQALATDFAARERQGKGLGMLSPRDTARATVGGAHVFVDYGRPSVRGRTVFGGIVPWGQVWRTGANEATQLMTDRDLEIGGTAVPAGTYSLWTVPSPDGWTLIINKQHGQWGTDYDAARDLAHVRLATRTLAEPVERFTIDITPRSDGAMLRLSWADTEASVPITTNRTVGAPHE